MRNFFFSSCGVYASGFLFVFGLFFLLVFPHVFTFFVNKEFQLHPKSQMYRNWRKTPIPVTIDFYLFNWTNPEAVGEKFAFTEMGPYRFYEIREKVDLKWNTNGTVSFRQKRSYFFNAEESNGTLDDLVTTANPVALTAAFMVRHSGFITKKSVNLALGFTKQKLWTRQTVGDMVFTGYSDELMSLAHKISPSLMPVTSPFDKFAWFYQRNNSDLLDGMFNVDTGTNDINGLGRFRTWNYRNITDFYNGECGKVEGFTGDVFPPRLMTRNSKFEIFVTDLCQKMPFHYSRDIDVHGIQGYQFTPSLPRDEKEECCNGECVPSNFVNLTTCRFGAPVFVSFPHFYDSKPFYQNLVDGMQPNAEKHKFTFTIEPTLGIIIAMNARLQLNMYMQPIPTISLFKSAPRLMFPVLWADQKTVLTEPLSREVRLVLLLPALASAVGVASLTVATIICIGLLLNHAYKKPPKECAKLPAPDHTTSVH